MNLNYLFIVLFSILCVVYCQSNKNDNNNSLDRSPRQFSFWSNNFSLSRQVYDMIDIVTDVAMLTILGIPILGIFAVSVKFYFNIVNCLIFHFNIVNCLIFH